MIKVEIENTDERLLVLIGIWLPFDDSSKERFSLFKSNLSLLESQFKIHQQDDVVIVGDWNADSNRNKRFDKEFVQFIVRNDLIDTINEQQQELNFTYEKGEYQAKLDHIVIKKENRLKLISSCIINDELDTSDHMPINVKLYCPISTIKTRHEEKNISHKFAWKNFNFKVTYAKIFKEKIKEMKHEFCYEGDKLNTIDGNLINLTKLHIKCARMAENQIEKRNKCHFKSALDFRDDEIQMNVNRIRNLKQDPNISKVI